MLDVRVRVVLGRMVVSVWCQNHGGPAHCLWSGSADVDDQALGEVLRLVSRGVAAAATASTQGRLEEETDDCGVA